ncbi:sensor histidine kinase [Saccharothrix syringae]|uniref:histidine kinase n=1 Tax=Saccharothrix syringae TaxID=103733 RepID=A0A5Q0H3Z9_SACSY|nr:histidine kinase [Saccharothrix syringae]QFZ20614.1 two-component sensor histidine kinase [Saccharothrix syringae]
MSRSGRVDTLVTLVAVLVTGLALVRITASGGPWPSAACVVAGCAAVLLRHRHPPAAWAATTAGVVLVGQADPAWVSLGALSQLALLHLVSTARRRGWAVTAVVTALVFCLPPLLNGPGIAVEADVAAMIAWTAGAVGVGHAVRSRRDYVLAVEDRARRAEQMREAVARRRVVEERLRIARELHDVVGHHVAVITVHAGLARRTLRTDPARSEDALVETENAARAVLREMAGILRLLRADDVDADTPAPGLERVGNLVDAVRRGGVEVDARLDGGQVPDLVSVTGYRVAQEALTNAARHGTGRVELAVRRAPGTVVVEVVNPVADAAPSRTGGHGLVGMRERVDAVGGCLEAGRDGAVFRVRATLPLESGCPDPDGEDVR